MIDLVDLRPAAPRRGAAPRQRRRRPSCGAGTSDRPPRYLPMGVRAADRRKASAMTRFPLVGWRGEGPTIYYKFAGAQSRCTDADDVLHATTASSRRHAAAHRTPDQGLRPLPRPRRPQPGRRRRARCSAFSAPTARASPRPCACCSASCGRPRGRRRSPATTAGATASPPAGCVAYLPGELRLYENMTGRQLDSLPEPAPRPGRQRRPRRPRPPLRHRPRPAHRRPVVRHEAQGGAACRCCTPRAPLLIMDEPTNTLDPTMRDELLRAGARGPRPGAGGAVLVARAERGGAGLRPRRPSCGPAGSSTSRTWPSCARAGSSRRGSTAPGRRTACPTA